MICRCCGRWRVTVELIRGRQVLRLAHLYRPEVGGGVNVVGEVATVPALEQLLRTYTRLTLADFAEAG